VATKEDRPPMPPPTGAAAGIDRVSDRPTGPGSPPLPVRLGSDIPVVNRTHLQVVTMAWQVRPSQDSLIVAIKGTFEIVPDRPARPRAESTFPTGELHVEDDENKSCCCPSDYAIFKPRADVLLRGHAHAPGGRATAMRVGLRLGQPGNRLDKAIAVIGDRQWRRGITGTAPTAPLPFDTLALDYEHAFGGPKHPDNPWGKGHGESAELPNLERLDQVVTSPSDKHLPACFAPLPMQWPERWRKLGTYDRAWLRTRWPYFPDDFDWSFYQAAPADQQLAYLQGDEPFELEGVHREHRVLRGTLPGLRPRCFVLERPEAGGRLVAVPLRLDTVLFEADAMSIELVWRGMLDVTADDAPEARALFVTTQAVREPELDRDQAFARLLAAVAPLEPVAPAPEAAPANDTGQAQADAAAQAEAAAQDAEDAAFEQGIRRRLASAGIDSAVEPPPLPPPPAPNAMAAPRRQAGMREGDGQAVLAALTPPRNEPAPAAEAPRPMRERVMAMLRGGESFDGFDFEEGDFSDLDFSGRSLVGSRMLRARLRRTRFDRAVLTDAQLGSADLTDASLLDADLSGADLTDATLRRARLDGARLSLAELCAVHADGATFTDATGQGVRFGRGEFAGASFERMRVGRADFTEATLDDARFASAELPSITLYDARGEGAVFDGATMPGARAEGAELPGASFVGVQAPDSVFENVRMDRASFVGANLRGASFLRAVCREANFTQADLSEARLERADVAGSRLQGANLMMASLEAADLRLCDLRGANLHAAGLWKAKLQDARLEGAIVTKSTLVMRPA
jgi:uncharacterized protein YjbI with pentapeptide repeats